MIVPGAFGRWVLLIPNRTLTLRLSINFIGCGRQLTGPTQFLYHLNDDAEGKPWNTAGVFVPLTGDAESMREVSSQLAFISGTATQSARITLQRFAGGVAEITMRPRFHWYMKGVGMVTQSMATGVITVDLLNCLEYTLAEVDDAIFAYPSHL